LNKFTTQQQTFTEANKFIDVFTMVHQTSNCHIQAVMNNLKVHNFRLLAAKKSWILD